MIANTSALSRAWRRLSQRLESRVVGFPQRTGEESVTVGQKAVSDPNLIRRPCLGRWVRLVTADQVWALSSSPQWVSVQKQVASGLLLPEEGRDDLITKKSQAD